MGRQSRRLRLPRLQPALPATRQRHLAAGRRQQQHRGLEDRRPRQHADRSSVRERRKRLRCRSLIARDSKGTVPSNEATTHRPDLRIAGRNGGIPPLGGAECAQISNWRCCFGPASIERLANAHDGFFQAMPDNFQAAGRRELLRGDPADLEGKEGWAIDQAM